MTAWSIALGLSSCSLLLDWSGYTGGGSLRSDAAGEASDDVSDDNAVEAKDAKDPIEASGLDARDDIGAPDVEVAVEAGPLCGSKTCGGCCNENGFCAGGESTATCGTGGAPCQDCSTTGQSCSEGTCSATPPPVDSSSPPVCNVTQCNDMIRCIPVYQGGCCKTDGTCGCQVTIPLGPCM
jgi:hypothetical protein